MVCYNQGMYHGIIIDQEFKDKDFPKKFKTFGKKQSGSWGIYGIEVEDSEVKQTVKKIQDNTYGYCEETGEPIGIKRLIARPIATLSIEAQEKHEKNEKVFADN